MGTANPLASKDPASPRRSLILAGGGMRVAYQAGVLKALEEAGLDFAHADGTSGGTMNLAMMLSGLSPDEMCRRWRTLDVHRFASFMPIEQYLRAWDMMGMGSADGIREYVFPHLGIEIDAIHAARTMDGTFNVCNYSRKVAEIVPHSQLTMDLLIAGISLPIFMPPVKMPNGDWYTDAVWIKDANLMEAVRRGAEELWVVWCIGNIREYKAGAFFQYVHMIEMAANGRLFEEFALIDDLNRRIANGEAPNGLTKTIKLHVIKPIYPLPLDPDFFEGKITASTLIEMGYADACRYLEKERTPAGLPLTPEVTQMKGEGVGVTFSKILQGGFALGSNDSDEGHRQGEAAKTIFTLRLTIRIHDVENFIAGAGHEPDVTGSIGYPAFGDWIPLCDAALTGPKQKGSSSPAGMKFSAGFRREGADYRLLGDLDVREPVADPDVDFSTLRCKLFRGDSAEVIGAGVLKLDGEGVVAMIRSMHATNAQTLEQKTRALYDFGRLYLREVWDRHAHHLQL